MLHDYGYVENAIKNIREVAEKQADNIHAAAELMADAIANDRLISVYGGGGHTTLCMGEMFFRANGMEAGFAMFAQLVGNFSLETILSPAFWGLGMDAKDLLIITCMVVAMFVVGALKERGVAVLNVIAEKPAWVRWGLVLLLFTCMLIFGAYGGDYEPVEPMYAEF